VIDGLEGEVTRVVVTDLRGGTYYAVLTLRARAGEVEIDSRPSDAIAIALRAGAPIFVRAELFESSGSKDAVETTTEGSPGRAI
jgi:bifunctional DNase/RNase